MDSKAQLAQASIPSASERNLRTLKQAQLTTPLAQHQLAAPAYPPAAFSDGETLRHLLSDSSFSVPTPYKVPVPTYSPMDGHQMNGSIRRAIPEHNAEFEALIRGEDTQDLDEVYSESVRSEEALNLENPAFLQAFSRR